MLVCGPDSLWYLIVIYRFNNVMVRKEDWIDVVQYLCSAESPSLVSGDIYDKVSAELEGGGLLDCECIGGGRIKHEPDVKKIHVYGYSIGYGRANHAVTTEKLKDQYPDYQVTWDNEGY
uniref:14 kDa phosphohistidine phosphatase n=1 Tax=Fundulus heteroclitus TaxID=8078 RepID=A0A3Q2PM34_FUNHE